MSAAATFGMYIGTKNGDTRLGPFSNRARQFSSKVWRPPVPVPMSTPARRKSSLSQLFTRRSEEHTSELQSQFHLVCRLLLEKKKKKQRKTIYHATHNSYKLIRRWRCASSIDVYFR